MILDHDPATQEYREDEEVIRIIYLHIFCITDGVSDTETL